LKVKALANKYSSTLQNRYLHDIEGFAFDRLGVVLWDNEAGEDSQLKIAKDVQLSISKQVERREYTLGNITEDDLMFWDVGEDIQTVFNAQSGHGIGKTFIAAVIALWLFDNYKDSITYTFSPTKAQATGLMWKEINTLHKKGGIQGKALELKVKDLDFANHFIEGRTVPKNKAGATESVHGQHSPVFLAILDEAQAYNQSLFDGVESILGSGIGCMIMLSNPRYDHVPAQKYRYKKRTVNYTISCFNHPNCVYGKQVIPGSVNRDYIMRMVEECEIVDKHNKELHTFTIPWIEDSPIYVPTNNFLWRVLGLPSSMSEGNMFFTASLLEDAVNKPVILSDPANVARIGVDVARFGSDNGVIYVRKHGYVEYVGTLQQADGNVYVDVLSQLLNSLHEEDITDVQVRLDATGGYASTIEDTLNKNKKWGKVFEFFEIVPVSFGAKPYSGLDYFDTVTELYATTSKQFQKGLRYRGYIPETLITELTGRTYDYRAISNLTLRDMRLTPDRYKQLLRTEVKKLSKKVVFRNLYGYSPDYSDSLCLASAPDWVFTHHMVKTRIVNPVINLYNKRKKRKRLIAW
jgi:hypothetical protein